MLEQEKAVQFRFDSSGSNLTERLAKIGLPEHARLFTCVGLPNIFGWQNPEHTESFQETWLFLPDDKIQCILNSQRSFGLSGEQSSPDNQSFQVDDRTVYPICTGGKINYAIAVPQGAELPSLAKDTEKLKEIEKLTRVSEKTDTAQIAFEFVSRLFDCKQSYTEFAKRLLIFLTDQVDKSYAGLYWKDSGEFHRRWAYGDLKLSDKLPLTIHSQRIERWRDANSKGKTFIPAELVQVEPVFVESPPSFLFIYQTPNFGDREQWLVLAVPGDITTAAIARIKIIASLLCSIDDDRMTGYVEMVDMFGQIIQENHKSLPIEEALKLCFRLLDSKLRMNSMCVLETDSSVVSCLKGETGQLSVERNQVKQIPDAALKVMETNQPIYIEGPMQHEGGGSDHIIDSERSRAFFPVPLNENSICLMSAEFSSERQKAEHFENLFQICAKYLGICLSLGRNGSTVSNVVGTPNSEVSNTLAIARMRTLSKLNNGYFHELIEHLSVILGQSEIMDHDLKHSRKPITSNELLKSTDRIVNAAILLADGLSKLKDVSTIKPLEDGKFVSSDTFIRQLSVLTFGHCQAVKDNKNVDIVVHTKIDRSVSFTIPILHVYDIILPLIITIMDEALCSGKIHVSITEHFGRPAVRVTYPKKLLGKLTNERLSDKVFKYYQSANSDDNGVSVAVDGARIIFSEVEGDHGQAIYTLTNQYQPVED